MPRYSRARPDFMAPGPNVAVSKRGDISFAEPVDNDQDDEDFQSYAYYESHKVLGKLYRDIDEKDIFHGIERTSQLPGVSTGDQSMLSANVDVMKAAFQYVGERCNSLSWDHLLESARNIREE